MRRRILEWAFFQDQEVKDIIPIKVMAAVIIKDRITPEEYWAKSSTC